jgi:hypothetical protein
LLYSIDAIMSFDSKAFFEEFSEAAMAGDVEKL